uniref:TP53 induced glycolysis regulatory phosphatase a n=1 Tax=Amphiprion ocellaris TaxID=80972 RepID=A0AAQ5ZSA8_AMPOC
RLCFFLPLIRCLGETPYNKEGLLQGHAIDSALSEAGLQQAEAAGRYLKDVRFSRVFVSDMLRAVQTAESILKHNSSCLDVESSQWSVVFQSFGIAEGRKVKELKEMAEAAGQTFPGFTPPNGETQEQVKQRVQEFLEKMLQQVGSERCRDGGQDGPLETCPVEGKPDNGLRDVPVHVLVVTHGALMCVAVRYFVEELGCCVPQGCDKAYMFSLSPNTGVCWFILTVKEEQQRFVLSGIRCVFVHRADHIKH